jgi:hypothetical protein
LRFHFPPYFCKVSANEKPINNREQFAYTGFARMKFPTVGVFILFFDADCQEQNFDAEW